MAEGRNGGMAEGQKGRKAEGQNRQSLTHTYATAHQYAQSDITGVSAAFVFLKGGFFW